MSDIAIIGAAGHGRVIVDIVEREGRHRIVGLIDRDRELGAETMGYRVIGRELDLPTLVETHGVAGVLIAVGDNFVRSEIAARLQATAPEVPLVRAVHPGACVARDVVIGEGSVVMAGAQINPCCKIGRGCILNTGASLDHDSMMGDFSSLAPGVVTGGDCHIGRLAAVGIGAVLVHGVRIGAHTVIGAGATVVKNIASHRVAYGTPARDIRVRGEGDRYL